MCVFIKNNGITEGFHTKRKSCNGKLTDFVTLKLQASSRGNVLRAARDRGVPHFCQEPNDGATRRDRTGDLLITNQPLYQLS